LRGRELALGDQSLSMSALWVGYGYVDQRLTELAEMEQQKYKAQLIQLEILQPPGTRHWTGKAEVQNNGRTLRFFSVEGIPEEFASRDEAEQYVVEAAKKLIDSLI
jgi:hypothetical protein